MICVARPYRPVRRDQGFLLPPDMREWLADDHLVWLVLDIVAARCVIVDGNPAGLHPDGPDRPCGLAWLPEPG
jgi:hypothetical protein